jgi:hypothetical protein
VCQRVCVLVEEGREDELAAAGGLQAVVDTMTGGQVCTLVHRGSEVVQESGCGALAALAEGHAGNQAALVAAGGVHVVVAAMNAHRESEAVQREG